MSSFLATSSSWMSEFAGESPLWTETKNHNYNPYKPKPLIYGELDTLMLFCCQTQQSLLPFQQKLGSNNTSNIGFKSGILVGKISYFKIYSFLKNLWVGWGKEAQSYVQLILCSFSLVKINTSLTKLSTYYRAPVSSASLHTCVSCET